MWQIAIDSNWFSVLFPVLLLISIIGGIVYAVHYKKTLKWQPSGLESSIMGIFGLIISFTFLMAGNSHRERYNYIHQEANAADLLYQNSREMPNTFRLQTKIFLINFLRNQLYYDRNAVNSKDKLFTNAKNITDNYRIFVHDFKRKNNDIGINNQIDKIISLLESVKSSFFRHAYSYEERTPASIIVLLTITSLLIGFLVGFMNGITPKIHYLAPITFFIMVTLIMLVIRDLNNPLNGFIRPNYHDLNNTYNYIVKS